MYVRKIAPSDRRALSAFVDYASTVYRDHPYWITPLRREVFRKLDHRGNPFYQCGKVSIFAVYDASGRMTGRAVAIINPLHEQLHGDAAGFFGLFECINDPAAARLLLSAVENHLAGEGCDSVIGPVNLSTNDESGFLLEGFDRYPAFMCNYCPPYYHDLMETCGYTKKNDTFSYEALMTHTFPGKYSRVARRVEQNPHVRLRHFTRETAARDVADIVAIYNASFRNTWGFVPLSDGEADDLARDLLPFLDEHLIWIAEHNEQPVGAIMGFPDINEILRKLNGRLHPLNLMRIAAGKRKVTGFRIAAFGVLPAYRNLGIETLMISKVHERTLERPYERAEFSVVMEDNHRMRNLLISAGFSQCRRFRIYGKTL
jgi:ribosomal protein S18 acetylase RimI-like enzyme